MKFRQLLSFPLATFGVGSLFFFLLASAEKSIKTTPKPTMVSTRPAHYAVIPIPLFFTNSSATSELISSTNDIFRFLHSENFSQWLANPDSISVLAAAFHAPYPQENSDSHGRTLQHYLTVRLGILRALEGRDLPGLKEFVINVLWNAQQHWIVKRQALITFTRNGWLFDSEEARGRVFEHVDLRAITTASLSDADLIGRGLYAEAQE